MSRAELPVPSDEALRLSAALVAEIRGEIERAGGWIDFARYMELALYAPGLGYYSAGSTKLGAAGDFVTAPELGRSFGRALALTLDAELAALGVERRRRARRRQRRARGAVARHVREARPRRALPDPRAERGLAATAAARARTVRGPSAMARPVARNAVSRRRRRQRGARCAAGRAVRDRRRRAESPRRRRRAAKASVGEPARAAPELTAAVRSIELALQRALPNGYRSEVCLTLPAWFRALGAMLERGSLLFADYGLVRSDYYHEQRAEGTLVCHYRHRAHDDPFAYPGLQDITAWVDFSACADAASAAGFDVAGFTTQGHYLLSVLAALPPELAVDLKSPREQSALKTLILPGEMGERFKVLLLRKNVAAPRCRARIFAIGCDGSSRFTESSAAPC